MIRYDLDREQAHSPGLVAAEGHSLQSGCHDIMDLHDHRVGVGTHVVFSR